MQVADNHAVYKIHAWPTGKLQNLEHENENDVSTPHETKQEQKIIYLRIYTVELRLQDMYCVLDKH